MGVRVQTEDFDVGAEMAALPVGKGVIRREGKGRAHRVAILSFGGVLQA